MSTAFGICPCCLGLQCLQPDGELRPSHKCVKCREIVHQECAVVNSETDAWICKKFTDTVEVEVDTESEVELLTGNDIEKMTVSVQPINEEFITITDDIKAQNMKQITKDYFVTKG